MPRNHGRPLIAAAANPTAAASPVTLGALRSLRIDVVPVNGSPAAGTTPATLVRQRRSGDPPAAPDGSHTIVEGLAHAS